ncbi:MAG TPA: zeta toxin family protein [Bryobacteraceae bacterium]|jgi:hypothetical protein|nr:zeta toxin family protein [Bryobacteraceae bacterium]
MRDADEQRTRETILAKLAEDPERYLEEYERRFGNVLNADNAATLFEEYEADRARYREAVHPAATWIRDELFRRKLREEDAQRRDTVVFTAGGNAAGKSTALEFTGAHREARAVLDSTFSNPEHARKLVNQVLAAGKRVVILYVRRPLDDAIRGMLDRAADQGRVVTIEQMIRSDRGAAETMQSLWREFHPNPRVAMRFVQNSSADAREASVELAMPKGYTVNRRALHEILDAEYRAGRITESVWRRIRGEGESGEPGVRGPDRETGG